MPVMRDGDITLRDWRADDAPQLAAMADNKRIADNLTDAFPSPYSIGDAEKFIASSRNDGAKLFFAICLNEELVGSIAAMFQNDIYRKNAVIAYYVAERHWGKGIASRAIRLLSGFLFANHDIERISAEPFERNAGSRKALEKAGFALEGILRNSAFKNGEILNSCMYSRIRA